MKKFKTQNVKCKIIVFLIFELLIFNFAFPDNALAELTADINNNHIKIDFFYHGSEVSVRGTSEPGTDLIITITSPDAHQTLKKKGKVAGLLWMNVGTLQFEKVPSVYIAASTKKLEDILSREEMDKYLIGYEALERHAGILPISDESEKTKWFAEFVKFQEASRLYTVSHGRISIKEGTDGKQHYYVLNDWPYQAAPGRYKVTVYAVKDDKIIEKAEKDVLVEQVSMVKGLADLAKNKGAFYGLISILVALGAGFGAGVIFRKGGGAH